MRNATLIALDVYLIDYMEKRLGEYFHYDNDSCNCCVFNNQTKSIIFTEYIIYIRVYIIRIAPWNEITILFATPMNEASMRSVYHRVYNIHRIE